LRQIERDTGSSFSRVVQCERKLHEAMRRVFAGDLEFRRLREIARRSPFGQDTPLDEAIGVELRALAAEEFWRKLSLRPDAERAHLVRELYARGSDGLEAAVKRMLAALPVEAADELLELAGADQPIIPRRDPRVGGSARCEKGVSHQRTRGPRAGRSAADRSEGAAGRARRSSDPRRARVEDRVRA
jgi:hypothetical protein